jgi:hypothetical protein
MPYRLEIRAFGNGQLMKHDARRSLGLSAEDAVRHGNVIVNIEVEAAAKALGKADSAAADVRRRRRISLSALNTQYPLPDGNIRENPIREMCGRAAHSPRVARRADAAQLARKRHEYFLAASGAPSAQKAVRVDAASQVGAQLAFDVARHTAVVRGAGLGQKRLEVSRDQPVKRSRLRSPLFVAQRRGLRGVPHGCALANGVPAMNLCRCCFWRLANRWRAAASRQVKTRREGWAAAFRPAQAVAPSPDENAAVKVW